MIVYKCDFCGKETKNENDFKKLSIMLGDEVHKTQHVCTECCKNSRWLQAIKEEPDSGESFYVMGEGTERPYVTRFKLLTQYGRKLTRADIYAGRFGEAQCEYAHAFMCGGFPLKPDPERPSKEEWMSEEPFPFEVDRYLSDKLFPREGK